LGAATATYIPFCNHQRLRTPRRRSADTCCQTNPTTLGRAYKELSCLSSSTHFLLGPPPGYEP
jgi:hypothetical protein